MLNGLYYILFWCLLDCIIRQVGNYMDGICFILVNSCVLWGFKLELRIVSSSTLGIVSHVHVDTPNHLESLGGRSLLRSGEAVHVCTDSL